MKFFVLVGALFVICQAQAIPVFKEISEIEGTPQHPKPFIVVGNQTYRVPYVAALYLNGNSFCGGSLISTRWVLTAAHCALGISTFTVHLGAQTLNNINEQGRVVITTTQKIIHSGYNTNTFINDIALINLGREISSNAYIQPINLASSSNIQVGNTARICGWFRESATSPVLQTQIKCETVTIISNAICQETWGNIVVSGTLCGLGSGSPCNVNSGGPLEDINSNTQIGIVSIHSSAGCNNGSPIVFVRVSSFLSWITSNTGISV